jgi:hypothetical protein
MCRSNDHIGDPRHDHMKRVGRDVARTVAALLIDDHLSATFPIAG